MSRVIPFVVYTEQGRVVLGNVDVENSTAELNDEGAALLGERLAPVLDEAGAVVEMPLKMEHQFVLNPYFPPPGGDAA